MVSETLAVAIRDIDYHLNETDLYRGDVRSKILQLRDQMDALRRDLTRISGGRGAGTEWTALTQALNDAAADAAEAAQP